MTLPIDKRYENRLLISAIHRDHNWVEKGCRESSEVCQEYSTILAQSVERIEGSEWHEAPWRGPCEVTEKVDQQIY